MLRFTQFAGVSFVRSWDPLQAFLLIYCDKRVENCSRRCLNFSDKPRRVVVYVKTTRNSRKAEKTAMDRCKMTELQRYHYAVWVKKAAGNKQMPSVCQLVCSVFHLPWFFFQNLQRESDFSQKAVKCFCGGVFSIILNSGPFRRSQTSPTESNFFAQRTLFQLYTCGENRHP